jgi:hypothetical protein
VTLFVTIEARLPQFIGAVVQFLSFRQCVTRVASRLCVVEREPHAATSFANAAAACGIHALIAQPNTLNPYLNKWSALDEGHSNGDAPAMLLDWDVINSQCGELPAYNGAIRARANPPDLYRDLIAISPTARDLAGDRDIPSSINGGVLMATASKLFACGTRTKSLVNALQPELREFPAWKAEQFALSIAVDELGRERLPNRWNVTPVSPVPDEEVAFFHYNDSVETTRRLKQHLHDPAVVSACLHDLEKRWPEQARRLARLHADAIDLGPVRSLMEMEAVPC